MSDYIPFEIQSEIMKRLPVKSLLQFRCVSKQWKSLIDYPEFIKSYHINHPNPQHHLLVQSSLDYTSIVDDDTFPQQKFPLTAHEPLNLLTYPSLLDSVDGLLCFVGLYKDNMMVVLWNPCIRISVGIPIPNVFYQPNRYTRLGFGVCRDTSDPKLVKINVVETPSVCWEVQVFTLTSRVWKTVYTGAPPFTSSSLGGGHVFIDGIIYWRTSGSFIISFDLKSDKFGQVCLPERLPIPSSILEVVKVNESLGLLESYLEGVQLVSDVWMRKDGANKPFTKMYIVKVKSVFNRVLGFRNNGEVVIETVDDDISKSQILVYEPSSRRIISAEISGESHTFSVRSYMETLLLLDQSNSIIH